jgi:hypothetical protein
MNDTADEEIAMTKIIATAALAALALALLGLTGCARNLDADYRKSATDFIQRLEEAVAAKDMAAFSGLSARAENSSLYKLFTLFSLVFEKDNPEYSAITLVPVEFYPAELDRGSRTEVRIKANIVYNGKIGAAEGLDPKLAAALGQLVNIGLPADMDLYLSYDKGQFKLKDYGFSPLYTLAIKGLELLL